jgi:DNA-binding transcriptional LysR family regulator
MKLHQLRYFLAVARTRNFTRAATECNVAQPSLTRAIQQLEDELGGPLFKRHPGQNELTSLGRFVHRHVQQVDDQLGQLRSAVQCWRNLAAPIRVGVQTSIGAAALTDFLTDFGRHNTQMDIEISDADAATLELGIASGTLDVAFTVAEMRAREGLAWHGLFREPMMIAFSGDHRFAGQEVVRLQDLHGEIYIDHLACDRRADFERELTKRGIELKASYRSNRSEWVLGAVAAGLGVAIAPRSAIVLPKLLSRPLIEPVVERQIGLGVPAQEELAPATAALLRAALAHPWAASQH